MTLYIKVTSPLIGHFIFKSDIRSLLINRTEDGTNENVGENVAEYSSFGSKLLIQKKILNSCRAQ